MKPLRTLTMASMALLSLAVSVPAAENTPIKECIPLSADLGGFDSMMPSPAALGPIAPERLTGNSAFLVAFIERKDANGRLIFGPNPQGMFVFKTTGGRLLVRFADFPPEYYWLGHF